MKKLNKMLKNSEKAITLISLVITIIVLLILAGISISMLSGDNSILQKAADAKTLTGVGQEKETIALAYNSALAKKVTNGDSTKVTTGDLNAELTNQGASADGDNPITVIFTESQNVYTIDTNGNIEKVVPPEPMIEGKTVKESKGNKIAETNTDLVDNYNNKITIPKGFKIASDSADNVIDGIVIEDISYTKTKGSQFVWIPVGTGENAIKKNEEGTDTAEIALDRYSFEDKNGMRTGIARNWTEVCTDGNYGQYYLAKCTEETTYREGSKDDNINATAKELSAFISSVGSKGGFYIGRYEARTAIQRTSSTPNDKTITDSNLTQITEKQSDYVYNWVNQLQAANLSRDMYSKDNDNNNIIEFASDLMNSYAWDTATLFLQECGEDRYSIKSSVNTYNDDGLAEKGTSTDFLCNVYDMSSNCDEWTTETGWNSSGKICICRGSSYYRYNQFYTSSRLGQDTSISFASDSFRPILYVK